MEKTYKLPELLAPAGSKEALISAICGGADAVYFGGGSLNARINAKNFTNDEIKESISLLHEYGKKAYITLNTLCLDREINDYLHFAEFLYNANADALIVADLGGANLIHKYIPDFELHASTQMSGHNVDESNILFDCGFKRMVLARETKKEDIEYFVKHSKLESEVFVHGALCVCHSGQCLFSSVVGGRSGNRGECAQPCRLPYFDKNGRQIYPLSLKDLSLSNHINDLIESEVNSLKIEGRMKSSDYVYSVVKAFRVLLDEGRNATNEELKHLEEIFSRGGFTDGYFKGKIDRKMLGVRSDFDKKNTKLEAKKENYSLSNVEKNKKSIDLFAKIKRNTPLYLSVKYGDIFVETTGNIPIEAINSPSNKEDVIKSLSKLGNTNYSLGKIECELDDGLMVPVSFLNNLRRNAIALLDEKMPNAERQPIKLQKYEIKKQNSVQNPIKSARFYNTNEIPTIAKDYFDVIYVPLEKYDGLTNGIIIPPVIFDSEKDIVEKMIKSAVGLGCKYALVGNLGAISLCKKYGLILHADHRLNAFNSETVDSLLNLGFSEVIVSPELSLPQIRDINCQRSAIVYGRLPLMLLEKCVIKDVLSCEECDKQNGILTDRKHIDFPILREFSHRNIIYNSMPIFMADRLDELKRNKIEGQHFIFSTESKKQVQNVINCYIKALPLNDTKITRM